MQLLTITNKARAAIIKVIESSSDHTVCGVRVSLKTKGCSGLSWDLELVRTPDAEDDQIPINESYTMYVDKKATLFILGTQLDYVENDLQSGFVFFNPKEKGRCGCGQSFFV